MPDPDVKIRTWMVDLVPDEVRLRCWYRRRRKRITQFTVQVELLHGGTWSPIVRYDNAHGFCHRDTLHADGSQDKTPVYFGSVNETFTRAVDELQAHWRDHRTRYQRELES